MSVRNPLNPAGRIRAVLFDLDGTLYRQTPMRLLMAAELLASTATAPAGARRRWRALRAYRRAQEEARHTGHQGTPADAQLAAAMQASGLSAAEATPLIRDWMHERPLKYLKWCRAKGLDALLDFLTAAAVRMGVLSDYPAEAKLAALGLAGRFAPVLCASDPQIAALKPSPKGFQLACDFWSLPPGEVLVVGDRADVDAAGAEAAGMPCVIIGRPDRSRGPVQHGYVTLPSLDRLRRVLDAR